MQKEKRKSNNLISLILLTACSLLYSCNEDYTPKPRAYFRIDLPEKQYQSFDTTYPFKFDHPVYSQVIPDTRPNAGLYWMDLDFPKFNGKVHLSYKKLNNDLQKHIEDSRTLTYKHSSKATDIRENVIVNDSAKVFGLIYDVKGNAASALQFYLTDSINHFVRGSLYFDAPPNNDSIAPVSNFVRQDIIRMIDSFEWK
jgi:gliding motility-associated lipoprotein GldD